MATTTIKKAIGAMKDQTSISLAKVASNVAPDLEVLVLKATTHDNEPADEKYAREILNMMSYSRGYVNACVFVISKRLSKTSDWLVALKVLMLVHKFLLDGDPVFGLELMMRSRKGERVLDMFDFRDDAHPNLWEHLHFLRAFALYLEQKLEFILYEKSVAIGDDEKKWFDEGYGESRDELGYEMNRRSRSYGKFSVSRKDRKVTPVRELGPARALERLNQWFRLLDRILASRPTGSALNFKVVLVALSLLVKDSFKLYADISDALEYLLECFSEQQYGFCLKIFNAYVYASKLIERLIGLHNWCKDIGVLRSSEFPEVQRISEKESLERVLKEKDKSKSPKEGMEESFSEIKEEKEQSMNEIKALPPPENHNPSTIPQPLHTSQNHEVNEDLVNLKDEGASADLHGLALALFSATTHDEWVGLPTDGEMGVTSAWQNPAAESGKADWELMLVESASNLSKQKADLAGGFDSLLLNGMYDQGTVNQHMNASHMSDGSASSVALHGICTTAKPVLALPAPDGTVQPVEQCDPFAASLMIPPPSYVQIADMERKQQLLAQEQQLWQQYASNGMQGQLGLAKISSNAGYYDASMSYGMGQHGYYYTFY